MPTYTPKPQEIVRGWQLIDADGKVLGRLAVEVATLLRGKNKPQFTPHADVGDFVVIINADKIQVTAEKEKRVFHFHHSGYPGGLKERLLGHELEKHPEEVIRRAVKGMLPRNRLGRKLLKKLKIYAGTEHPHQAQFKGTPSAPNSRRKERVEASATKSVTKTKAPVGKPEVKKAATKTVKTAAKSESKSEVKSDSAKATAADKADAKASAKATDEVVVPESKDSAPTSGPETKTETVEAGSSDKATTPAVEQKSKDSKDKE